MRIIGKISLSSVVKETVNLRSPKSCPVSYKIHILDTACEIVNIAVREKDE